MPRGVDTRWDDRRKPYSANVLSPTANVERQSQLISDNQADREMQEHNERWFALQRAKKAANG